MKNYLLLIPLNYYLIGSNLYKTLSKSVYYPPKTIEWYLTHVIPLVIILDSYLCWAVCCVCSLSISPHIYTVHVWTFPATYIFILVFMYINKTRYSFWNHRLLFSCEPNRIRFPILVACLYYPFIDGMFPVITLFQISTFPTWHIFPLFLGK